MVNPQCQVDKPFAKHSGDLLELNGPSWTIRDDRDHRNVRTLMSGRIRLEVELEHDRRGGCFNTSRCAVHPHRSAVGSIREHPRIDAAKFAPEVQRRFDQLPADAVILMRRRNTELIEPQFRRFVRMHVVNGGHKADDAAVQDCNDKMVSRVGEKLWDQLRIERVIEDAWSST